MSDTSSSSSGEMWRIRDFRYFMSEGGEAKIWEI